MTQTELLAIFDYDNGILKWKVARTNNIWIGKPITCKNKDGYTVVGIGKKIYRVNRIIFCMFHGYMPEVVDHEDRDIDNNKIENLRAASKSQNGMNAKTPITNTSGIKGVSWCNTSQLWISSVQVNKKQHKTKHKTKQEAEQATIAKRNFYHKQFANH